MHPTLIGNTTTRLLACNRVHLSVTSHPWVLTDEAHLNDGAEG